MGNENTLAWAINQLAQLQGASIDPLRMESAMLGIGATPTEYFDLSQVCQKLGLPKPTRQNPVDRVSLPLICFCPKFGAWGLIVDRQATGEWLVVFPAESRLLAEVELAHVSVVLVNLKSKEASTFDQVLKTELKRYSGVMSETVLTTLLIGIITLGISMYSMQVYDRVLPGNSESTLITLSVGVVIAILFELVLKFTRSHMMNAVAVDLDARLSRDIFQRLLNVRIDELPSSVGSLAAQIRGYEQIRGFYAANTLFTLVDLPISLIFIVVIGFIGSSAVVAVPLFFALLSLAVGLLMRRRLDRLAEYGAIASNKKTGLLIEAVEGAETIKSGAGGWKFLSRWISFNAQSIQGDMQIRHATESTGYYVAAIHQISYATLVAVGAYGVMEGTMTIGSLIACSIISGRIMTPIVSIPSLLLQKSHASAAQKGLEALYRCESDNYGVERPLIPQQLRGNFFVKDVKFFYGESSPAIFVSNLRINHGEKVAILGPIGAGKSTVLKILAGILKPQHGCVLLDGLDMSHISRQVLSQHIGYLQQEHRLFHGTLRENLLIGLPDPGDEVICQVLVRSGLMSMVSNHPKGLEMTIAEGGKGLSGGQRQLVAFTRILLCKPEILLLDEPTANMDGQQEAHCIAVLSEEIQPGKTFVVVTHKPTLLPLVDRIVVISGHQVLADGPRDDILKQLGECRLSK